MPIRSSRVHFAVVLAGCGLLALLIVQLGPARILSLMGMLGPNAFVIVALFGGHESVRALALGLCLPGPGRPSFRARLRIRLVGDAVGALTRTGPFGAEPLRAWMLAGHGGSAPAAYAAAVSEVIANSGTSACVTIVVTAIALTGLELHGPVLVLAHVLLWSSMVYVSLAIYALTARIYLIGVILRVVGRLPAIGRWLATDAMRVRLAEDAIIQTLTGDTARLVKVLALELAAQAILIAEIFWVINSMGVPARLATALLVEVLAKAVNIVQFVGVTEAGYAVLFDWLGLTAAVGLTLSLVKMLRSLLTAAIGLAILNWLDRGHVMLGAPAWSTGDDARIA